MKLSYGIHSTPFGQCLIVLNEGKICKLSFEEHPDLDEEMIRDQKGTKKLVEEIFSNRSASAELHLEGTEFQLQVWEALMQIPRGTTTYYQEIAKRIGKPKAVRAVASAIANNPIAYIVPCHRVIRKSGHIHKYRWGADLKKALLNWERFEQPV